MMMASSSSSKCKSKSKVGVVVCMNVFCRATSSIEWKKGWDLRSGHGFANLCHNCGSAYDQLVFCETFHQKESGWRECSSCGKRLHCGCIASRSLLQLLDNGGVECINCMKNLEQPITPVDEKPNGVGSTISNNVRKFRSSSMENKLDADGIEMGKLLQIGKNAVEDDQSDLLQSLKNDPSGLLSQIKRENIMPSIGDVGNTSFSNLNQPSIVSCQITRRDNNKELLELKSIHDSLSQTCLSINLGASLATSNLTLPMSGMVVEGRDRTKQHPSFQQGHRSRHLMPKPPKLGLGIGPEATKDMLPQIRVARPPVEGRGRNQLLPRYWPRITEQELQQISGDSNSTIVPLFEKVLSASDAGRIGRLVLPKACAEAYFPPISQPEGLPLRIQDAKGKEWLFQFRFWPNNNSRMYVLEGVTPCIQSMQLQAGDTVTFSRIDPEGKLVMGFRKASQSSTVTQQDTQVSTIANGALANTSFFSGVIENLPIISGYSGFLQSLKGSMDPHLNALSVPIHSADSEVRWRKTEQFRRSDDSLQLQQLQVPEKKRSRNIGSKSKRLLMDSEAALELKITWEEAQNLLRPPPSVKPSIVVIEDHEFEEYEESPVFGKNTIFTSAASGEQAQWAQCDSCSKWRRLPVEVLLPPIWTCIDNVWDPNRCACSVPDDLSPKQLENLLRLYMDMKKQRIEAANHKLGQEHEHSGLDTLATAAVFGENGGESGTTSVATTTRHPRHRPGCTCIVCIQPPSGKGPKHKPTCTCNVCMTVKRRFKTLMMRKKKRQSEKEAEIAHKYKMQICKDDMEVESVSRCITLLADASENEGWQQANESESGSQSKTQKEMESGKGGQIDLNCDPDREGELRAAAAEHMSMMSLLQEASLPLDTYLKEQGLRSLVSDQQQQQQQQQANSSSSNELVSQKDPVDPERAAHNGCLASSSSVAAGRECEVDDVSGSSPGQNDPVGKPLPE